MLHELRVLGTFGRAMLCPVHSGRVATVNAGSGVADMRIFAVRRPAKAPIVMLS